MKKFLLLFLLIGAALLAAPGIIGFSVEGRYQVLIDRLEQAGFKVVDESYQRGWFGAMAETRFRTRLPQNQVAGEQTEDELEFSLKSQVIHGPLTPNGFGLAEIESDIWAEGKSLFPADYPATIRTLVGLDGGGRTQLDLPSTELVPAGEGPRVQFGGLSGEVSFDADFEQMAIKARMPGLSIAEGNQTLIRLAEASLDSRSWRGSAGLVLGDGSFTLKTLEFSHPQTINDLSLGQVEVEVESSEQGEQVGGTVTYRLKTAKMGDQTYGPAVLRLEITNLAAPVLVRMRQALDEIEQKNLPEAQRNMAVMAVMMASGPELLKTNPGLALKQFRLVTPDGIVDGDFSLRAVELRLEEIGDSRALLDKLAADLSFRLPERLFRLLLEQQTLLRIAQQFEQGVKEGDEVEMPAPEQLQQMVRTAAAEQLNQLLLQGVVERDGADIVSVASLSNGLLTVNGKTVPLNMLTQ